MKIETLFKLGMDRTIKPLLDFPDGIVLNLGAGNKLIEGSVALDYPEWDADSMPIPYQDGAVSGVHAYHFLEHCSDPVAVLIEVNRVLCKGGVCNIIVPYYKSQMAAHDFDHKKIFCEETWRVLFDNPYYNKNRIEWKFEIGTNIIIGVVERNLALMTQLVKI